MQPEIRIEHRYPAALGFLREHGPQALAVLHELLIRSERHGGKLVARASTRDIAEQLGFLSKDTVHRRLRQLVRAGVLERVHPPTGSTFAPTIYVVHLTDSGITLNSSLSTPINDLPA
jgi:DNA-binding HxlR family transcriptional regulator